MGSQSSSGLAYIVCMFELRIKKPLAIRERTDCGGFLAPLFEGRPAFAAASTANEQPLKWSLLL